jgi:hypothetical protein
MPRSKPARIVPMAAPIPVAAFVVSVAPSTIPSELSSARVLDEPND